MKNINRKHIAKRLKEIIKIAREYEIDASSQVDGYDYLISDVEDFSKEINVGGRFKWVSH